MILKIQDPGTFKWFYYDNIAKISFNYNEYFVSKSCKIYCKDSDIHKVMKEDLIPDASYVVWLDEEDDPKDAELFQCKVVIAIFRTPYESGGKGGNEMCIAFNGKTYLLNDEGKTIERIS